jgi:murein DD-endopeptidase MepM/ murein hydrolase activator NlpD
LEYGPGQRSPSFPDPWLAERTLVWGQQAGRAGDRAVAEFLLQEAVGLDPTLVDAWVWLAAVSPEPNRAIACLEQALHLAPDDPRALRGLAVLRPLLAPPTPQDGPSPARRERRRWRFARAWRAPALRAPAWGGLAAAPLAVCLVLASLGPLVIGRQVDAPVFILPRAPAVSVQSLDQAGQAVDLELGSALQPAALSLPDSPAMPVADLDAWLVLVGLDPTPEWYATREAGLPSEDVAPAAALEAAATVASTLQSPRQDAAEVSRDQVATLARPAAAASVEPTDASAPEVEAAPVEADSQIDAGPLSARLFAPAPPAPPVSSPPAVETQAAPVASPTPSAVPDPRLADTTPAVRSGQRLEQRPQSASDRRGTAAASPTRTPAPTATVRPTRQPEAPASPTATTATQAATQPASAPSPVPSAAELASEQGPGQSSGRGRPGPQAETRPVRLTATATPTATPPPPPTATPVPTDTPVPAPPASLAQRLAPAPAPASRGMLWPARGPITTYFGFVGPLSPRGHAGIDIAAPMGSAVLAAQSGVVDVATRDGSYGIYVLVDHGGGLRTLYAHLSQLMVSPGQRIGRGELVGLAGSTGFSTGPHLHFEVRQNGALRDPLGFLP